MKWFIEEVILFNLKKIVVAKNAQGINEIYQKVSLVF